ncbi:uncharacterized protein LOC110029748 isoform X2 [Phalaenopsis equestris]|uniref:uncharacterized protein LOC110029748 isoform X2 n=1 Tax=Phalaenopsis equestris TaxID=78828 RepID=UPI0009E1E39D|nr:uncharacterized protein LOC110029748 isoform X2 [Phalaenopsis equestris]
MASRGTRKGGTHRMDGAIAALTPLGFSKKLICDTIRELIKAYEDNDAGWYFVEENYYRMVIDKIMEEQDKKNEEDKAVVAVEGRTTGTSGQALLAFEDGSCSNRELSSMVTFSSKWTPIEMEVNCDMAADIELSKFNPTPAPKRKPCYGWISEDED